MLRYRPVRSRCLHPGQQQGRRWPSSSSSRVRRMRRSRVAAIVHLPTLKVETFGRDLSDMLQARLTFDEALAAPSLTIMTRQRLKIVKGQLFGQLDQAAVL